MVSVWIPESPEWTDLCVQRNHSFLSWVFSRCYFRDCCFKHLGRITHKKAPPVNAGNVHINALLPRSKSKEVLITNSSPPSAKSWLLAFEWHETSFLLGLGISEDCRSETFVLSLNSPSAYQWCSKAEIRKSSCQMCHISLCITRSSKQKQPQYCRFLLPSCWIAAQQGSQKTRAVSSDQSKTLSQNRQRSSKTKNKQTDKKSSFASDTREAHKGR